MQTFKKITHKEAISCSVKILQSTADHSFPPNISSQLSQALFLLIKSPEGCATSISGIFPNLNKMIKIRFDFERNFK